MEVLKRSKKDSVIYVQIEIESTARFNHDTTLTAKINSETVVLNMSITNLASKLVSDVTLESPTRNASIIAINAAVVSESSIRYTHVSSLIK